MFKAKMGFPKEFIFSGGMDAGAATMGSKNIAASASAEPVKVKDIFDLKLKAVDAKAKIKIIKEIRTITGLGLKEVPFCMQINQIK